ncbi:MAG: ABC transporter ATP-binding protein [Bullifex sp.]
MSEVLLEVKGLKTVFTGKKGKVTAVDGISFSVDRGKCLCIVGESGCGKSVTSLSILRLIPRNTGTIEAGEILFDGTDILTLSDEDIRKIRGNRISMIFQDSMTGLNPVMTIGKQVTETIKVHSPQSGRKELEEKAVKILSDVGIPEPAKRMKEYPHQLSGGMRQRVMIALALSAGNNELLIADEPTTALDVTIQAQILRLMNNLKADKGTSIILITHDMGVVAEMADYVMVMYAGKEMEYADVNSLFESPLHPYTSGLLKSIPKLSTNPDEELFTIKGSVPGLEDMPKGCRFCTRCTETSDKCFAQEPPFFTVKGHKVRCWKYEEDADER